MGDDKTIKGVDASSPYYLHPSYNTNIIISPVILRGKNYDKWARSMRNAFKENNKIGFLDGMIKSRTETESNNKAQWVQVSSMLVPWIHNTVDVSIRFSVPITDNVKDMWDDIRLIFSAGNGPRINEIKHQIATCEQEGNSVVIYYGKLRQLWQELTSYLITPCSCACSYGSKVSLVKELEDELVHQFLSGLDSFIYGNVQTNMLMLDPLSSLNGVLNKTKTHARTHMINRMSDRESEAVDFAMQGETRGCGIMTIRGFERRNNVTCAHCGKSGHEHDNCFELLWYPDWLDTENPEATKGIGHGGRGGRVGGSRGHNTHVDNAAAIRGSGNVVTPQQIGDGNRLAVPSVLNEQWQQFMFMFNSVNINCYTAKFDCKTLSTRWIIDTD